MADHIDTPAVDAAPGHPAETHSVADSSPSPSSGDELRKSLHDFVRRAVTIVQAEKCVIMLFEPDSSELVAQAPALRFTEDEMAAMRIHVGDGWTGEVFRDGAPRICHDCTKDIRCIREGLNRLGIHDALSVPMVVERRNQSQQVVETFPIGVLHVFNKRHGLKFTDEDTRLLTVLARNAAAIIASAQVSLRMADEKKQLEYTLRNMPAGLLAMTRNQHLQLINATAARMFDLQPGDGIGSSVHDTIRHEEIRDFLITSLAQEASLAQEFQIGERFYQAQTDIERDERGTLTGVLCAFNDVTELRNVERMKSDFVSTVSHELRTPLTAIKGFVRTLLDDPTGEYYDQDTRMEFYNIIDSECDRLIRLISDLLNVSRIERGLPLHMNYTQVDVPALVEKCLTFHRGYTDRHELVAECDAALPTLEADRDKLDQVLSNLISNAIKYSPEGGTITVAVADGGEALHFAVRDQGMGIPEEHLEKVFQRFHRVNSGDSQRVGGTGIGLFLTRSLVEAHGGAIGIDSALGQGTTFRFTIPKQPPADRAAR